MLWSLITKFGIVTCFLQKTFNFYYRTVEVSDVEDDVSEQETPQVVDRGGFFRKSFKFAKKGVPYELQVDDIPGNEPLPKEEV